MRILFLLIQLVDWRIQVIKFITVNRKTKYTLFIRTYTCIHKNKRFIKVALILNMFSVFSIPWKILIFILLFSILGKHM